MIQAGAAVLALGVACGTKPRETVDTSDSVRTEPEAAVEATDPIEAIRPKPGQIYSIRHLGVTTADGVEHPFKVCKVLSVSRPLVTIRVFNNILKMRPSASAAELDFSKKHVDGLGPSGGMTSAMCCPMAQLMDMEPVFYADSPLSELDREVLSEGKGP
jgi:hypothetical protein